MFAKIHFGVTSIRRVIPKHCKKCNYISILMAAGLPLILMSSFNSFKMFYLIALRIATIVELLKIYHWRNVSLMLL